MYVHMCTPIKPLMKVKSISKKTKCLHSNSFCCCCGDKSSIADNKSISHACMYMYFKLIQ